MPIKPSKPSLTGVLSGYEGEKTARFHMPGHKGRPSSSLFDALYPIDVTEIDGTDDLAMPEGAILSIEQDWADAFFARNAMLLVNGSTSGVIAMLLAIGRNKRVLLGRDCHRSAYSGIALAGHEAAYVYPEYDCRCGVSGVVSPSAVSRALDCAHYDAVLITSPNYYGMCVDIEAIAEVAHSHGALLLVDNAHGAHFPFHSAFPHAPIHADLWCVSAHKTLCALTQTALLFIGASCPIPDAHIRAMKNLITTSSPSYLLTASLEEALSAAKRCDWAAHTMRVESVRQRIGSLYGLCAAYSPTGVAGIASTDPLRLVVDTLGRGLTGIEAQSLLRAYGIVPEMADASSIVLITSPQDPDDWYSMLYAALDSLPQCSALSPRKVDLFGHETVIPVREAMLTFGEYVPLSSAKDRICAAACGIYPPGNALVCPGERITAADIEALNYCVLAGYHVFGLNDNTIYCVPDEYGV